MKIALCLSGYFGTLKDDGTSDTSTAKKAHEYLTKTLFSKYDVDVYVHCWQPEYKDEITELYNPRGLEVEPQKDFKSICEKNNISQEDLDANFPRHTTHYKNALFERILSFYYSRCKSIKMAIADGSYDWIITTRFDISERGGYEVGYLMFDASLNPQKMYSAYWRQLNHGYGDMWFYSSSENMKTYSNIYESALKDFLYKRIGTSTDFNASAYIQTLYGGWPDSDAYNMNEWEPEQFTNLVLYSKTTTAPMRYLPWRASDSHLHHKWFFMTSGLYEKCAFIDRNKKVFYHPAALPPGTKNPLSYTAFTSDIADYTFSDWYFVLPPTDPTYGIGGVGPVEWALLESDPFPYRLYIQPKYRLHHQKTVPVYEEEQK